MTDYTKYVAHSRPRFKPGEYVRIAGREDKYMVESSEWHSIDDRTTYMLIDETGRRSVREEGELVAALATPADRYKNYLQSQQQRLMLNSFYGIKIADLMGIKKVIFNNPATIVLWNDGTKTVVKCSENDTFDPEKGLAFCFLKKLLGNNYYKTIKSEVGKYDEKTLTDIESTSIVNSTLKTIANNLKTDLTNFGNGGMFP